MSTSVGCVFTRCAMKVPLLFVLFLVIITESRLRSISEQLQTKEAQEHFNITFRVENECRKELGQEKFKNAPNIAGLLQIPEDNESLNAVVGCSFKKRGIIDAESHIDITVLKAYIWEVFVAAGYTSPYYLQPTDDLAKSCYTVKGKDFRQTAVMLQNCIMRYLDEDIEYID